MPVPAQTSHWGAWLGFSGVSRVQSPLLALPRSPVAPLFCPQVRLVVVRLPVREKGNGYPYAYSDDPLHQSPFSPKSVRVQSLSASMIFL